MDHRPAEEGARRHSAPRRPGVRLQAGSGESALQGSRGAVCRVHWGHSAGCTGAAACSHAPLTHHVCGGDGSLRSPHLHLMLAQHPADSAVLDPQLQCWPCALQSQPSRGMDTNTFWGRTTGSGPAALFMSVSLEHVGPVAWDVRGASFSSCQCQWTHSCTRRTAASPHRSWLWVVGTRGHGHDKAPGPSCFSPHVTQTSHRTGHGEPGMGPQCQPQGRGSISVPSKTHEE